jgi:hypothetical protein
MKNPQQMEAQEMAQVNSPVLSHDLTASTASDSTAGAKFEMPC